MALIVQKFGGSSVADPAGMKRVAHKIAEAHRGGNQVVVVVSAMGDTTDELIDLTQEITKNPPKREMDILLTAGERISMSLLAMAVNEEGVPAKAFTGQQAGLITDTEYGNASIINVNPARIIETLDAGSVAIIAGFQGVNKRNDVTTLGRGGSDTTAVAFAVALNADMCEIYTDVDGVFSADPRIVHAASQMKTITYEETLELAAHGVKVLHLRAVEYARKFNVPLHVRSSFSTKEGTKIVEGTDMNGEYEGPAVVGVAHDLNQGKISVVGVSNTPGVAAKIFSCVANADGNIDMIVQNTPLTRTGISNISFTVPRQDVSNVVKALEANKEELGFEKIAVENEIGILSVVGAGMRTYTGVSAKLFNTLGDLGINVDMISTSEIRISVVLDPEDITRAAIAVHSAFGLDSEEKAIVYGGTGR